MSLKQGFSVDPFAFRNGKLFCEDLAISSLIDQISSNEVSSASIGCNKSITYDVPPTPVFIYSEAAIQQNVSRYLRELHNAGLKGKIGYAIKANPNIHLVEKMKSFGVEMIIAVSGYEVLLALRAGFSPQNILLNGNGKQAWEVKLAIEHGAMLNVDSEFDAKQIVEIHQNLHSAGRKVLVLLRVKPKPRDEEATLKVHDYVNTAENSKFGFEFSELDKVLDILSSRESIKVMGVHCHFGSCIGDPKVYEWLGATMSDIADELKKRGISAKILNVGGGIGIDYFEKLNGFEDAINLQPSEFKESYFDTARQLKREHVSVADVSEFMRALSSKLPGNVDLILEPGRSLIGKAGILLCKVLGRKVSNGRHLLVVDGSMNEVIRPCLYGAHHRIMPTSVQTDEKWATYDVVGPICESADFLGKNVPLQSSTEYVAVMDCGAYCGSMASNYNLKPRAAEILVNIDKWTYIRKRDTFHDIIDKYYYSN